MDRQDAHDATIQDMITALEVFGRGEGDPDDYREFVSAVIERYELYRAAEDMAEAIDAADEFSKNWDGDE